ncbi:MAG TPA: hypothetical protein VFS16_12180 [Acidimicrobiia bacterium]|nr:hypothetical protein [Acidimicrobiia bacterium]
MRRTAELRWFRREPFPSPVGAWFDRATGPPQTRSDRYLVLPGTDALGVKVRGGSTSFELKLRPEPGEATEVRPGDSGRLEEWQKWSLDRTAVSRFLPRLGLPRDRWITVVKHRRTVSVPHRADAGCTVELTALEARGQSWTTLGFEAFGPPADLRTALQRAVETFFSSVDALDALDAERSCGYPGWLATL